MAAREQECLLLRAQVEASDEQCREMAEKLQVACLLACLLACCLPRVCDR